MFKLSNVVQKRWLVPLWLHFSWKEQILCPAGMLISLLHRHIVTIQRGIKLSPRFLSFNSPSTRKIGRTWCTFAGKQGSVKCKQSGSNPPYFSHFLLSFLKFVVQMSRLKWKTVIYSHFQSRFWGLDRVWGRGPQHHGRGRVDGQEQLQQGREEDEEREEAKAKSKLGFYANFQKHFPLTIQFFPRKK